MLLVACMFCCGGCRKISETKIIGRWVYKIDLPEEKTGLKNINESTIEFFNDNTFKTENIPAVIIGAVQYVDGHFIERKGKVTNGHGTWELVKSGKDQIITLHFLGDVDINNKFDSEIRISMPPFCKISLFVEYAGSHLCFFTKVGNLNGDR